MNDVALMLSLYKGGVRKGAYNCTPTFVGWAGDKITLAFPACQAETIRMKTKTKTPAKVGNLPGFRDPEDTQTAAPASAPATAPESSNGKPKDRFQISFDLNEDGTPDFSAMRGKTKEKVRQFFTDPKIAAEFGSKPADTSPQVQIFHPAMISSMYDMLGTLEAIAAQRWGKIPPQIAKQVFTYTETEKEALTGPTIRVMNKYAAEWMIKYQDEIALATLLIALTTAKVNAAILMSTMHARSQAQNAETPKKETEGQTTPTTLQ